MAMEKFGRPAGRLAAVAAAVVALAALGLAAAPRPASRAAAQDEPKRADAVDPADDASFLPPPNPVRNPIPLVHQAEILDLEPAVAQAELILAARLVDVTETTIVHGGQNAQVTQQFRFEPVRVLKGLFARDALLMTGQDLGIYRFAEGSDRLERGQLLLVLLGRQGANYFNCNSAATLNQSIPRLDGEADPLLPAVEALVGMSRLRDRSARVKVLREALQPAEGREAAPLLIALGRRAPLAARDPAAAGAIVPHLKADSAALREVAARTLSALLQAVPPPKAGADPSPIQLEAARGLAAALADAGPDLAAKVAMIDALGEAGAAAVARDPAARAWIAAEPEAATFAETASRLLALGELPATDRKDEAARAYEALALDAPATLEQAAGRALGRLDPPRAAELIAARLAKKDDAGLDVSAEIDRLGRLPAELAVPPLLAAWERPLAANERLAYARAAALVPDARLIPSLSDLLDPRQYQTRLYAMEALRKINTGEAASTLAPHLDEEADPTQQLRLVAFLGRHGLRDGYPRAIEHVSQPALRDQAVAALAALNDPRAVPELRRIWQESNDLAWNAAALRGLARLGQADIAPRLLEIAATPGDSLAPSALLGLGDLGTPEALPIVREALNSRRDESVIAATRAAARLLSRPALKDDAILDRLAALLADADASPEVRRASLDALAALNDPRLGPGLLAVARDANLEGSPLLIEAERRLAGLRAE